MYSSYYSAGVGLGIFIYILVYFGIGILLGIASKHINESKGYSGGFAWGFWLGIIGIIVVACKPNINNSYADSPRYDSATSTSNYHPRVQPANYKTWKCVCGQENSENLNYCTRCRRTRDEAVIDKIACPNCGAMNKKSNNNCFACGRPMYETSNNIYGETAKEITQTLEQEVAKDTNPNSDLINLLKQLSNLHDQGVLTDQEFETKKSEILAKI